MKKGMIVFLMFCILFVGSLFASSVTVFGKIRYLDNLSAAIGANITIYNLSFNGQELQKTVANSTFSNLSGDYNLTFVANQNDMYSIQVVKYNESNTRVATHVSIPLPEFPYQMFTSVVNNTNVSLINATTIFVNATNETGASTFSGWMSEDGTGMQLDSFMGMNSEVTNRTIHAPLGKNYSLTIMKLPPQGGGGGAIPRSITINTSNLTSGFGRGINISVNLSHSMTFVMGNITVVGNTTAVNITGIMLHSFTEGVHFEHGHKLTPGQLEPNATQPGFSLTQNIAAPFWNYTFTVDAAGGQGIKYMMIVYANTTNNEYFAGFQNMSAISGTNLTLNVTLRRLVGEFSAASGFSDINTTKYIVRLSSNGSYVNTTDGRLKVEYASYSNDQGSVPVVLELSPNSSGFFKFPMITGYNATASMFSPNYAPIKKKINTSLNITYINVSSMEFGPPGHEGGGNDAFSGIRFNFYRSNATCNTAEPPDSCRLTNFGSNPMADGFNPMSLVLSWGNILNVRMNDSTGGFVLYLIGVDLLGAGPPAAQYDQTTTDATSGSSFDNAKRVGSLAPDTVQYIWVGFTYSDTSLNDSANVSVLLSQTFDDDWNSDWNASAYPNGTGTPSYYGDYNQTFFNASQSYGNAVGGVLCSTTDANATCFINTSTNLVWFKIPHFSGSSANVLGAALSSSSGGSTSSSDNPIVRKASGEVTVDCSDQSITVVATPEDSTVRIVSENSVPYYEFEELENGEAKQTDLANGIYNVYVSRSSYQTYKEIVTVDCEVQEELVPEEEPRADEELPVEDGLPEEPNPQIAEAEGDIHDAEQSVENATDEKRSVGLDNAKQKLEQAREAFENGDYENAKGLAAEAKQLADNATKETTKKETSPTKTPEEKPPEKKDEPTAAPACPIGFGLLALGIFVFLKKK